MRMMTGALLILASVMIFGMWSSDGVLFDVRGWVEVYAYILGGLGWLMLFYGLYKDISAEIYLQKRHRHKGDT